MDEVDGMAGNEDRGGIQELIQLIKSSRVPVICTCNDRRHPKIRSLTNYCFDLQFSRPNAKQILVSYSSPVEADPFKSPRNSNCFYNQALVIDIPTVVEPALIVCCWIFFFRVL